MESGVKYVELVWNAYGGVKKGWSMWNGNKGTAEYVESS